MPHTLQEQGLKNIHDNNYLLKLSLYRPGIYRISRNSALEVGTIIGYLYPLGYIPDTHFC